MLRSLIEFSLRFRGIVIALAALLVIYGLYVTAHAKLDVFPDFVPPQVTIQTEAPGFAPEDVEALVTRPLEAALNGLGNQEALRSETIQGLSVITIVFREGSNVQVARQMVAEKLNEAAALLPAGVKTPKLSPLTSSTMDLLKVGLLSTNLSPMELRTFADWTLKPRLLAVQGVAKCSSFGGEVRQLQVQVHPEKLLGYNVAISDVLAAARLATGVRGAGFIENAQQRITLETEGQSLSASALREILLSQNTNNFPVRLGDVATVTEAAEPKVGDALIMGKAGVLLTMSSQPAANTMEVTRALETALEEFKPTFERMGIQVYPAMHRPATFIERSIHNIKHSLLLGAVFVSIVLFLFLGHFRTAFISLTAIPLSLLSAVIVLDRLGMTLNTITLGGLAIALGEVVDDAIIDVENIFRRLRENQALAQPRPVFNVVLDASIEVRSAVVYATFVVGLVFLPVLALTGLQGSFFSPLALSYILAIVASLGVALTVTPALALLLFRRGVREKAEPRIQRWLKTGYVGILRPASHVPHLLLLVVLLVFGLTLATVPLLKSGFLPEFREGHFVLQVSTAPGTSMPEMLRMGRTLSERLLAITNIATVEEQIGRAELGEDTWGPNRSEFHAELKPVEGEAQAEVEEQIRSVLKETPGIQFEVTTFLGDRISESISGETAPVVVSIYGDDLDAMDEKAREIAAVLQSIKGAEDVQVKASPGTPTIRIQLRAERVATLGFRPVEVLEAIQTAYQGAVVSQVYRANEISDVVVILDPAARADPEGLGSFFIRNSAGTMWPLKELASIRRTGGRSTILHELGRRRQTITCNPAAADLAAFVRVAREQILAKVVLPKTFYFEISGAAEQQQRAEQQLLLNCSAAAVGIVMLLSVITRNWRNLLVVLANMPFALIGGVLALHVAHLLGNESGLSMGALVGFVTLFGITTRNSIMLISHYEHLVISEGARWDGETAIRGASERLVPILMTALVTALGLLPLALGSGEAGREIEGPMAIVILGGLVTSTLLNLVVLPSLTARFGRFQPNPTI